MSGPIDERDLIAAEEPSTVEAREGRHDHGGWTRHRASVAHQGTADGGGMVFRGPDGTG
jgi:hypothetical protein